MDDLSALLAERDCTRLITEYCRLVDFGEAERIAELFTADGVWEGPELVMDGRDAIRTWFARRAGVTRRTSRHLVTNVAVDVVGEDEATALCYLVNYRHDSEGTEPPQLPVPAAPPKFVGEYHDRLVRTDAGWRFAHRRLTVTFQRAPSPRGPRSGSSA
jgi:hypothetical protein